MRVLVQQIQSHRVGDLQTAELVALARRVDPSFALTIDFDAVHDLGFPLMVMRGATRQRSARALFAALSARERQVAILMASGLRNREVAEQLSSHWQPSRITSITSCKNPDVARVPNSSRRQQSRIRVIHPRMD